MQPHLVELKPGTEAHSSHAPDGTSAGPTPPADQQTVQTPERLWTKADLAAYLSVCPRTLDNLLRLKKLPALKITGGLVRFVPEDVKRYLATHFRLAAIGE